MRFFTHTTVVLIGLLTSAVLLLHCDSGSDKPRVLIFNKSEFYVHECMPAAVKALEQICRDNNWKADVTDDAEVFTEKELRRYAAVVFLNTAGDVLNPTQEIEFERYIQAGGGFVGIHTALDTEHNWKWYGQLVGGLFDGMTEVQTATIQVQNREHPATKHLGETWSHRDEWFNVRNLSPDVQVLLRVDESTFQGGKMGAYHPVSWYHEYDGGRAFFTALGHTTESYSDPDFLKHLQGGLQYAIGNNREPLVFKALRVTEKPNTVGFVKTSLLCDLYEPMQFEMLPDGRILFIERRGSVKLFDPATRNVRLVGEFAVYIQNEEGLLGMTLDPNWEQNHWIYLYYSPEGDDKSALQLSRFVFKDDSLYRNSEKVLLEVVTDRTVHNFHAGGCLEFDAEGYLYLSTGDNTDHYGDGYTSIDERPGKSQYDSQKSAANSMDLRGKFLRIKPMPDGSYICPAGNLFTDQDVVVIPGMQDYLNDPLWQPILQPNAARPVVSISADFATRGGQTHVGKGRPEIYVMGVRNPFRFTIDNRRKLLIWGEPGPDAGVADSTRGPEGYDEVNIARTAGFYGWPYFIGPNKPYRDFDFATEKPRGWFDPNHVINDSPNNTGDPNLPPARPPIVWYPFKSSTEFPLVQNGTRCAMGGPVYYCDQYPAETRFPDKYDGKVIIYEWMRNWMLAVGIDSLDRFSSMDPLAPSIRLARPIDMLIDKNGSLWVLEYGTEWYSSNPDACLSRIDYIPGDGADADLALAPVNAAPTVNWNFGNQNRSFYQPGETVQYQIQVSDPEDGSLADGRIQPSDVLVHMDYLEAGVPLSQLAQRIKPKPVPFEKGKALVNASDCQSCHAVERKVNGPAYLDIAKRYKGDKSAPRTLAEKIIKGGLGVWGETAMSAHPQLAPKDVNDMVRWILSLTELEAPQMQGTYPLNLPAAKSGSTAPGTFVFHAAYTDRGGPNLPAQQGSQTIALRPAFQQAEQADSLSKGMRTYKRPLNANTTTIVEFKDQSSLVYKNIDLRGISSVSLAVDVSAANKHTGGGQIELRLDAPDGPLAGSVAIPPPSAAGGLSEAVLKVGKAPSDGSLHDVYFLVKNAAAGDKPVMGIDWLRFNF